MSQTTQPAEWEVKIPEFPHYLTIVAKHDADQDNVTVTVNSTIHVNKSVVMPTSWSYGFVRDRYSSFLGDIMSFVIKRYGLQLQPTKYL